MRRLISLAAVLALALARPETYKETEDFNFSRSSTDEGSKSGFYNAQRGNMGGNYERAHNMDGLAQHQMSTAVKQVEGELGEASNMKSGQVFTSAQSGGMFGSGHYDVSNLQGRNFQENAASDSLSHSSLSSHHSGYNNQMSSMHNSGYAHNTGYGQYHGSQTKQSLQNSDLQAADLHGANYGYTGTGLHGTSSSHSSGHSSQSGYHSQTAYDSSNADHYANSEYRANPQNRMIYTMTPVRVYGRPGSRVAVPVGVQNYDANHRASMYDQNSINSEAEVLNTGDQRVGYKPTSNAKHYESSYNYRKQWEKHDVKPEVVAVAIPTENPLPQNSELYEDSQLSNNQYHASGLNTQDQYSSSRQHAHTSNVKSSAIHSQHAASSSNLNSHTQGAYTSDGSADTTNVLGDVDTKPKSYQSSYSYHKSWERQGDPYVIQPVGGTATAEELQRLTAASNHNEYSSQHSGSNYQKTHQGYSNGNGLVCCDVNGYRRVARSVNNDDLTQQSQSSWGNIEDLGQKTQNSWDRSDALRQANHYQSQFQQQNQNDFGDNLEDLGQQTQNSWDRSDALRQANHYQTQFQQQNENNLGQQVQQKHWDNLEDLGQQTQNSWDRSDALRQARNHQGQVQQKDENNLEQKQVQQNSWTNTEEFVQRVQPNKWGNSEDLTQQTQQHGWDNSEHIAQRQRHLDQDILSSWPGYISNTEQLQNKAPQESTPDSFTFENEHLSGLQDKQMTQVGSSGFSQEQYSPSNIWSNHQQQSQANIWSTHVQNEVQPGAFGGFESQQQANKPWENSEYLGKHKYTDQRLEPHWSSISNQENYNSYDSQREHQQTDTGSFALYDWSQASADKKDTDFTQVGNLWDEISEVDAQISASNNFQHMGWVDKISNGNFNLSKHNEGQNTIIHTNNTSKPKKIDNPLIPKNPENSQDIGRGDIGPEENIMEHKFDDNGPISLRKQNNISTADQGKQAHNNEDFFKNNQFHNNNSTMNKIEHSLWMQGTNISGSRFENQSTFNQAHQYGFKFNKTETQFHEHKFIQRNRSTFNNVPEKSSEKINPQNGIKPQKFESTNTQQQQQQQQQKKYFFTVDEVELEQINQNLDQKWQQIEKNNDDNETVWGMSRKAFMEMPQKQDKAETFGVRIKNDRQKPTPETQLAEKFRRDSENLNDAYQSNHNLPYYNMEPPNQTPLHLQTTEASYNIQSAQVEQEISSTEVLTDTTTSNPGFWKRAKNKVASWFKSS